MASAPCVISCGGMLDGSLSIGGRDTVDSAIVFSEVWSLLWIFVLPFLYVSPPLAVWRGRRAKHYYNNGGDNLILISTI